MKYILTVNNMFVGSASIDSYDGTTRCLFTSNSGDAREFLEVDAKIIKFLLEDLLSIKVSIIAKGGDTNDD